MKGLNRDKISRKAFLQKELTENPDFFKAFPEMQSVLGDNEERPEKTTSMADEEDFSNESPYYKAKVVADFRDPSGRPRSGYFPGLLNQHN
jgi:hypothetical protein